ncbi:hypothetical protein QF028_003056 [Neobacillus sp. B4I6]
MRTYNEKVSIYHGMVSTIAVNLASNFFLFSLFPFSAQATIKSV